MTSVPFFGKNAAVNSAYIGSLALQRHKRREQYRHLPVTVGRQRARGHDGGHGAAEADQHRHDAAARQADLAQQLVHHKGHARHIAAVLQHGQEEEQHHDDRQEAQHAADARKYAVDHQRMHHRD